MDGAPRERAPSRPDRMEQFPHWRELADAVWLSAHWPTAGRSKTETDRPPEGDEERSAEAPTVPPLSPPDEPPEPNGGDTTGRGWSSFVPDPDGPRRVRLGLPVLPRVHTGIRGPDGRTAALARALHRLARRVPSRDAVRLDEEATAERGVYDGLWMPWFRPAEATAFDLVLLVDDAPTMAIWGGAVAALSTAAEQSGAFRAVRTVRVTVPAVGEPTLRWSAARAAAGPGEILGGRGDRVFMVVTDGLGHGWAAPPADHLLDRLGRAGPTAVVHLLRPHLRHRSSLYPHAVMLEAGGFGADNRRLGLAPPAPGPDPMRPLPEVRDGVPVPVLSLKPGSLAAWADLVVSEPGVHRAVHAVVAGTLRHGTPAPGLHAPRRARTAVQLFSTLATRAARRLATQLAAVPLDFELIEQLRLRTMPETGPEELAEILMGGLIDWGGPDTEPPEFAEGVRETLLASTTRTQLARTIGILGELPAAGQRGVALRAALRDPLGAALPDEGAPGWRQSELAVMRALSGPYAERARLIEEGEGDAGGLLADARRTPAVSLDPAAHEPTPADTMATGPAAVEEPAEPRPVPTRIPSGTPALLVNVPLRNTAFVGRRYQLRAMEEQLGAQEKVAVLPHALLGLGGVGKSQLALEYVYTHQHEYQVICWISAEREALILSVLSSLASQLGLAPPGDGNAVWSANRAVPAVLEALRTGVPYGSWLLVFDNAEDVDLVRSYFPTSGPGKVIVTSRNRAWERVGHPLSVNVFEREESVALLQRRSPDLATADADRLAEALGDLPLAVEQAGSWRAVTGMQVDEYLDLLHRRSPDVLELDPGPDYPVSVAAAWDISLDRIRANNPGARQLLDICACMAPEPIPLAMLRSIRGLNITPEIDPLLRESIRLARAIRDLSQFSLVRLDPRTDTLQMHRLLQTVLLTKLAPAERKQTQDAAHQLLAAAKPGQPGDSSQWRGYQALLPHVLSSEAPISTDSYVRELVHDTVLFLYYWGDREGAADLARWTYGAWLATSGEEDMHVVRMAKTFAFALRQIGQIPESIPLTERALEVSRRIDVEEDLVDSLCEMADARRYQGRFQEARDLGAEATGLARSLFGTEDPITLRAVHSWGVDLRLCGQYAEALPLDRENARLREMLYGSASFFTLNSLNALAIDMRESGDYPGARAFQEDLYHQARREFGEEHPLTLRIALTLAVCRRRDGELTQAATLSEETLRGFLIRYGSEHPDSLAAALDVAVDRRLAGDLASARELGETTARRWAARLGDDHLCTLVARANQAATMRAMGVLDAAEELDDDVARRLAGTVGLRHVTVLTVAMGRANTAYARLDFEQARAIDEATLPTLTEVAGERHPLSLSCAANLSLDLRGLGLGAEANELQRTAVEALHQVVRHDHPWILSARQRQRIECDMAYIPL
ncbi:FxSxx-COOH system tetratricopeptide repeat protein [Streptomyces sp. NPDC048420]|uniref:FxSxx-COOH system tetratricopeptide repeat protein n=1 Tax=Streptomyces sp. NPDC048420 TaxID=3155755 RepID=UPI003414EC03